VATEEYLPLAPQNRRSRRSLPLHRHFSACISRSRDRMSSGRQHNLAGRCDSHGLRLGPTGRFTRGTEAPPVALGFRHGSVAGFC
jgi:hypothetical protein